MHFYISQRFAAEQLIKTSFEIRTREERSPFINVVKVRMPGCVMSLPTNSGGKKYTVEQAELIRRLRNSGMTKEQVLMAFESFDLIDQCLGNIVNISSLTQKVCLFWQNHYKIRQINLAIFTYLFTYILNFKMVKTS